MKLRVAEKPAVIPAAYCPICGHKCDRASVISEDGHYAEPRPGDYTACIDCGGWLVFRADFSYRKVDEIDIRDMDSETHIKLNKLSKAIKQIPRGV